jgi:hypothetical protein
MVWSRNDGADARLRDLQQRFGAVRRRIDRTSQFHALGSRLKLFALVAGITFVVGFAATIFLPTLRD